MSEEEFKVLMILMGAIGAAIVFIIILNKIMEGLAL